MRPRLRFGAAAASLVVSGAILLAAAALPASQREVWRERAFDALIAVARPFRGTSGEALHAPIVVVDIDRASVSSLGPWPWRRELFARLIAAIARSKPRAVGLDILFAGPETRSPAAMARRLAAETGRQDLADWAQGLADDDKGFAEALAQAPAALGFALDSQGRTPPPGALFSVHGPVAAGALWRASGAIPPVEALADAAAGFGALPLPGDADGVVRRAPGLVAVGDALRPGLALETLRLALAEPLYDIASTQEGVKVGLGRWSLVLPSDGMVRLAPDAMSRADVLVRSAGAVLAATSALPEGAIVLVGASVPEAGALRASAGDPLTPTVRLQAAALAQLRDGRIWRRSPGLERATPAIAVALAAAALAAGVAWAPAWSVAALLAAVLALGATAALAATRGVLWDPTLLVVLTTGAGLAPTLVSAAATYRRERRVRRRFEQHLAPAVVQRIIANPGAVRLAGERRTVTALFTDLEGFTAMTTRLEPETLMRLLDGYFEGLVAIIQARGGMIDKFVGDAVHAFFGMPLDLEGHAEQAIHCAAEIEAWTEGYRRRAEVAPFQLGRTRIGVESGEVVAGEVGAGVKLDYTAYGDAVNLAARLEAANKQLGTAICVGPEATRRVPEGLLRPTGRLPIRGLTDEIDTSGPWPAGSEAAWRAAYLAAWEAKRRGDPAARAAFAALSQAVPADPVSRRFAGEERSMAGDV